jgi:ectoine hydroxylase-related dioxygenase (phytanoyl-CoA dioxygenase family)
MDTVADDRITRQQIEKTGYVIVPDVLSSDVADQLIVAIRNALNLHGSHSEYAMRNLAQSVPEVRQIAENKGMQTLLRPILKSPAFLVRSIFFDKTRQANWKVAWHQDLTVAVKEKVETPGFTAWSLKEGIVHVQPSPYILDRMLTVRLHLDDCGPANGPLQVIPGSHTAGRLSSEQIANWRKRQSPTSCLVKRGGALLMRPLLLHASSPATEPEHRRVVHLEFATDLLPNGLRWLSR